MEAFGPCLPTLKVQLLLLPLVGNRFSALVCRFHYPCRKENFLFAREFSQASKKFSWLQGKYFSTTFLINHCRQENFSPTYPVKCRETRWSYCKTFAIHLLRFRRTSSCISFKSAHFALRIPLMLSMSLEKKHCKDCKTALWAKAGFIERKALLGKG